MVKYGSHYNVLKSLVVSVLYVTFSTYEASFSICMLGVL